MTDEEASETYDFIQKVDYFTGIKTMDFDEAKKKVLLNIWVRMLLIYSLTR